MANVPRVPEHALSRPGAWWRVLRNGFVLYVLGLAVLILSENPNIFPTVLMLGSFLVPATYVAFFYEHRHLSRLSVDAPALSFFYGGVLGLFSAALLEPLFISRLDFFTAFEVGLIEELAKILGVLAIARRRRHNSMLDGLILGAAAGMGFAALESTGYAFTAFLRSGGNLTTTVAVTLLRGLLLPSLIYAFVGSGLDILLGQSLVAATGIGILWHHWREAKRLQEGDVGATEQRTDAPQ
ncbi:MAG: PrsW family glutamic-type intramembrane protease [Acidobacteriota bacterium]